MASIPDGRERRNGCAGVERVAADARAARVKLAELAYADRERIPAGL